MKNYKNMSDGQIAKEYSKFIDKEIKKGLVGHSLTPNYLNKSSTPRDLMIDSMRMHQNYLNGNFASIYPKVYPRRKK